MHKSYKFTVAVSAMFLVSLVSGYSWDPRLKDQAIDSFLFLAPSGLLKNLGPDSPYAEAYQQISGRFREGFLDQPSLIFAELLLLVLAFLSLRQWRKKS